MTDFMRSRNTEEDMAEDKHLWRLGVNVCGTLDPDRLGIFQDKEIKASGTFASQGKENIRLA